jgi:hypothetical protein
VPDAGQPAQQVSPGVQLDSAFALPITGQLTLTFTPESGADDPAVQFSSGGRTAPFNIPAGATQAVFTASSLGIQTGTVAGTINVTGRLAAGGVDLPSSSFPVATIRISRAAPVISSVRATRTGDSISIVVTGFSTPRDMTSATFRFTAAAGSTVQTTDFTVQLGSQFTAYYQGAAAAPFGSQFTLTMPFTVSGNSSAVTGVSVTLTNSVGTSPATAATF